MRTKKLAEESIYQITVSLIETKPLIWRRLLVPSDLTLAQLHDVLQVAMGWENSHLHCYTIGNRRFEPPDPAEMSDAGSAEDERTVRLCDVMDGVGATARYTYDFGDNWEHLVQIEEELAAEQGKHYPCCMTGERRCPPENCGGIPGYQDLLEAVRYPKRKQSAELLAWVGKGFDPEEFSTIAVNKKLAASRPLNNIRIN